MPFIIPIAIKLALVGAALLIDAEKKRRAEEEESKRRAGRSDYEW